MVCKTILEKWYWLWSLETTRNFSLGDKYLWCFATFLQLSSDFSILIIINAGYIHWSAFFKKYFNKCLLRDPSTLPFTFHWQSVKKKFQIKTIFCYKDYIYLFVFEFQKSMPIVEYFDFYLLQNFFSLTIALEELITYHENINGGNEPSTQKKSQSFKLIFHRVIDLEVFIWRWVSQFAEWF